MTKFADVGGPDGLPEDKRIDLIGHRVVDHHEQVGFIVEDDEKADRYVAKLVKEVSGRCSQKQRAVQWRGRCRAGSSRKGELMSQIEILGPDGDHRIHIRRRDNKDCLGHIDAESRQCVPTIIRALERGFGITEFKPVLQTRFGEPEGNCFAACVASISGVELSDIPDLNDAPKDRNWLEWFNEGLHERNFGVAVFCKEVSAEAPLNAYIPLGCYFIACGPGPRRVNHCVVFKVTAHEIDADGNIQVQRDDMVHDPHPDGDGIVSLTSIYLLIKR